MDGNKSVATRYTIPEFKTLKHKYGTNVYLPETVLINGKALYDYNDNYKSLCVSIDYDTREQLFLASLDFQMEGIIEEKIIPFKKKVIKEQVTDRWGREYPRSIDKECFTINIKNKSNEKTISDINKGQKVSINCTVYCFTDNNGVSSICYSV